MTIRSRFINACKGNPVDRVPLFLKGFQLIETWDQINAIEDPLRKKLAERIYPLQNAFHINPTGINRYFVTPPNYIRDGESHVDAAGNVIHKHVIDTPRGELRYQTGSNTRTETSWHVSYPAKTLDDLEAIRSIPWNLPMNSSRLEARPDDPDQRLLTMVRVSSPVVCVADTMRFEMFLELCATNLDYVVALTRECHERISEILNYQLGGGTIDMVWIGGSEYVTPPMASPKIYEKLVVPFEAELIQTCHRSDALVWVHCHGSVRDALNHVANNGAELFEPVEPPPDGNIVFKDAKQLVGGRITLGGNVESRIIERGDREEVECAVHAAFTGGKERMLLIDSAGSVRKYSKRMADNYHTLIDTWESAS